MSTLRVTCVIPVYNGERFLGNALDSALGQSRPPDEIIVVDDGSTDATAAVAARYGGRIAYHRHENAGPAVARNRGIKAGCGDLVAILDADDLWHTDKLARQVARSRHGPNSGSHSRTCATSGCLNSRTRNSCSEIRWPCRFRFSRSLRGGPCSIPSVHSIRTRNTRTSLAG